MDLHGIISGFKALTTWDGEKYSEIIKQACGGHGYMQYSGLTKIHTDFGFGYQMTEGDNTVMAQQTSKYLLKQVQTGKIILTEFEFDLNQKLDTDQQLLLIYEMRYKNELMAAGTLMQAEGGSFQFKWNEMALVSLVNCTVYFCEWWALKNFYDLIKGTKSLFAKQGPSIGKLSERSPKIQKLMHLLFRNRAFYNIHENTVSFYKNMQDEAALKFFDFNRIGQYKATFKKEMEVLAMSLPDICDGYGFDDRQLTSVLGKKHGSDIEMYQEMLDNVRNNPLNKVTVAKGFNQYIKPMIMGKM